ncbi:hypothetical protein COV19_06970 [Candidatus Woesearchaeota archaeon CG10_big_fil_rev_8_21_14_0_10_44_13]|nr:MAG: hypothetical protein COV19_06970 [Candidatus Woesearchaeota archaeon CG10_big_fil_rev_8_21_14_0_10_44_13]
MRKQKTIIFDFGGVIVNDLDFIYSNFSKVVRLLGKEPMPKKEYDGAFSPDWVRMYRKLGIDEPAEKILALWMQTYASTMDNTHIKLYRHAKDTLDEIRKKHNIAINTGYRAVELGKLFPMLGLKREDFDFIVTEDMITNRKPHPESLLLLMKRLGAEPSDCMFIGDTISEIECGKAAGCMTIAATWGANHREDLINAGPDIVVDSWKELHEKIEALR